MTTGILTAEKMDIPMVKKTGILTAKRTGILTAKQTCFWSWSARNWQKEGPWKRSPGNWRQTWKQYRN